ncbi:hypothetical protein GGI35DRAFT_336618 [Trichoderma velutinum]
MAQLQRPMKEEGRNFGQRIILRGILLFATFIYLSILVALFLFVSISGAFANTIPYNESTGKAEIEKKKKATTNSWSLLAPPRLLLLLCKHCYCTPRRDSFPLLIRLSFFLPVFLFPHLLT